jgi:predicted 3-demethylubiquinone-9 3-methyltransferase (glyoxalase superfamily)
MQKITPCLWFEDQAEEAAEFYVSVFNDSRVKSITRYGKAGARASGRPEGTVMTVTFEIQGQEFVALNGGPLFKFSEAISFMVKCDSQAEIDEMWAKLSAGGEEGPCGWLKDKYGLSWQIVTAGIDKMLSGPDAAKSERVMEAVLRMGKLDIAELKQAFAGE